MATTDNIVPIPQDLRWTINSSLQDKQLAALDDNARFIVRRMVTQAYGQGFGHGWAAGQNDAYTDRVIERDRASVDSGKVDE